MSRLNNLTKKIKIGITMGDPSGIGGEIIIKALSNQSLSKAADLIIIGDRWVFEKALSLTLTKRPKLKVGENEPSNRAVGRYEFIDLANVCRRNFLFGKIKAEYGRASVEYLNKALDLLKNKKLDCLVTCPVSKEAVTLAGLRFFGQTEFLAQNSETKYYAMMLLNKKCKICLLTRHIPIDKVASVLNEDIIFNTIFLTYNYLKKFFKISKPRLVVCGLNPHASDNGVIGHQENEIIKPALRKLRNVLSRTIEGPISADVAILQAKQGKYDCVIAMYHDQALIPLKLLDARTGVNVTLGLPFIRTSPLHGTAYDIAGRNFADCASLISAIKLAAKCAINRKVN